MNMESFEIDLLLNKEIVNLKQVSTVEIFEQNSTFFNESGLFSTDIFGDIGTLTRNISFGYIKLGIYVIHPLIFKVLTKLSSKYIKIIKSELKVKFKNGEFIEDDEGDTGFTFFISNYDKLKIPKTESIERDNYIKFLKSFSKEDILLNKIIVLPAGLRDYEVKESGKVLESDVNELYRKVIRLANFSSKFKDELNYKADDTQIIDQVRYKLQISINNLYDYFFNLIKDKQGFIQSKFGRRSIFYSARNVITGTDTNITKLEDSKSVGYNTTIIGLYQYCKSILPLAIKNIRDKFLHDVLNSESYNGYLINKDTLNRETIDIDIKYIKRYSTDDGLEELINKCKQESYIMSDIVINNHYLHILYDDGDTIIFLRSITDLPSNYDKKYIRPMKYIDLLFLSIYELVPKYPGFMTRYPVANYGSIYITRFSLKPTVSVRKINYIQDPVSNIGKEIINYPNIESDPFTSMSVNPSHIGLLGADYDGDKLACTIVWEDDSIEELENKLKSVEYYVDDKNNLYFSNSDIVVESVVKTFTM